MTHPPAHNLRQRLTDALLTTEAPRRLHLAQAGLAMLLMALSIGVLVYAARVAGTPTELVVAWALLSIGGLAASYLAIRSGWSRRLADPSLTLPQMLREQARRQPAGIAVRQKDFGIWQPVS